MKIAERIVMLLLLGCLLGGAGWIYVSVKQEQQSVRDAVARGEYEKREVDLNEVAKDDWRILYPNTIPVQIGSTTVLASVADTLPKRIKGLSDTPFLPENVVKLFVFGAGGEQSIWMKDMRYSIDILWMSQDGYIVHIEENVAPETYPESFSSPTPAWYVIETNAGFVAQHNIALGERVRLVE
ncbi:DUF192 domain-containing protein [Candidatus Kaiserbacteria bacterium]|nr:DUF192 domain-containing protein [Candidatus Kaiserbacteria bacterium]USN88462.1 MAG: DUF192 domain-containing protein [Candidatus Nomurabacteria bacterium]